MADLSTPAAADNAHSMGTDALSSSSTPAKPRSRWRRYSLRALLLFQVVIAVFVGYVVLRVRSIQGQHAAAKDIGDFNKFPNRERHVEPVWFWEPICHFCGCPSTDILEIWAQQHPLKTSEVERLPYLERLSFYWGIEDEQVMESIARLTKLNSLQVSNNDPSAPVTNEALIRLKSNCSIQKLILNDQFSDEAIAALADMPGVTTLEIRQSAGSMAAIETWIDKNRLTVLGLPVKLKRDDMARLVKFQSLERLAVFYIDEQAATFLQNMPNLKSILIRKVHSDKELIKIANLIPGHIVVLDNHGKPVRRAP